MRYYILILFATACLLSCSHKNQVEKDLHNTINKKISLNGLGEVNTGDTLVSLEEFRGIYKNITLVFLEEGCNSCEETFKAWQENTSHLLKEKNHALLFIIHTRNIKTYLQQLYKYLYKDSLLLKQSNFHYIVDPNFSYLVENRLIPRWIIDRSVLIDQHNRIRMVGAPWASPEMTELFHRICSEE